MPSYSVPICPECRKQLLVLPLAPNGFHYRCEEHGCFETAEYIDPAAEPLRLLRETIETLWAFDITPVKNLTMVDAKQAMFELRVKLQNEMRELGAEVPFPQPKKQVVEDPEPRLGWGSFL